MISQGLWLHFFVAVFFKNRQVSKGALPYTPYTQVLSRERVSFPGGTPSYRSRDQSPGGHLGIC